MNDAAARRTGFCRPRPAFSLVELIVVVLIIGILAAIAVPRLSRGSQDASLRATAQDLTILQRQIEFYAIEHGGVYPAAVGDGTDAAQTEAAFVSQLTKFSDINGETADQASSVYRFGPYLRKGIPELKAGPKAGFDAVKVVSGDPEYEEGDDVGWVYSYTTGEIVPNMPGAGPGFQITDPLDGEAQGPQEL